MSADEEQCKLIGVEWWGKSVWLTITPQQQVGK